MGAEVMGVVEVSSSVGWSCLGSWSLSSGIPLGLGRSASAAAGGDAAEPSGVESEPGPAPGWRGGAEVAPSSIHQFPSAYRRDTSYTPYDQCFIVAIPSILVLNKTRVTRSSSRCTGREGAAVVAGQPATSRTKPNAATIDARHASTSLRLSTLPAVFFFSIKDLLEKAP